jgi:hypothetical protein
MADGVVPVWTRLRSRPSAVWLAHASMTRRLLASTKALKCSGARHEKGPNSIGGSPGKGIFYGRARIWTYA